MKNQPEFITKMQEKVEEIRLAQEVKFAKDKAMGFSSPVDRLEDAIVSLQAQGKLRDDNKVLGIAKKLEALNKELVNHLNATYEW